MGCGVVLVVGILAWFSASWWYLEASSRRANIGIDANIYLLLFFPFAWVGVWGFGFVGLLIAFGMSRLQRHTARRSGKVNAWTETGAQ